MARCAPPWLLLRWLVEAGFTPLYELPEVFADCLLDCAKWRDVIHAGDVRAQ